MFDMHGHATDRITMRTSNALLSADPVDYGCASERSIRADMAASPAAKIDGYGAPGGRLPKVRTAAQRFWLAPLHDRPNHCSYCLVVNALRSAVVR